MAAAADENVIRRSVYQNSNTLVEVLIKSKEPARGRGRGRALAQTAPGWPAAVPVRKDGRPVALPSLPSRPRAGRRLPVWHQAPPLPPPGQQRQAGVAVPARGGQQGTAAVDKRAPQLPETAGKSANDADQVPSAVGQEFQAWTRQLNRLVQDIKKRPATAHLRPLLTRLEETVRLPPTLQQDADQLLRIRLEEIQRENEELQSKFQSLSASMQEYRRSMEERPPAAVQDRLEAAPAPAPAAGTAAQGAAAELADVKHQLAKYRKYASKLTKTKENLLAQIETMEQQHASDLKALKEEHEAQISQVLAQVTSETEVLSTFRSDAEAVQRSMEQHVRENAALQRALAEREDEIRRLTDFNRTLQELGRRQLQGLSGSQLPSIGQLTTKLQSPSAGGAAIDVAPDAGGDRRPVSGRGAEVNLSLDVTGPTPQRPFPGPDLSICSLVSFAPLPVDVTTDGPPPPLPDGGEVVEHGGEGGGPEDAAAGADGALEGLVTDLRSDRPAGQPGSGGLPGRVEGTTYRSADLGGHGDAGIGALEAASGVMPDQDFLRSVAWLSERLAGLQGEVGRAARAVPPRLLLSP